MDISAEKIENRREEIISLSDSKKRLFEQAGLLLRSAHALNRLKTQICEEGYSAEKGFKFCMNVLQKEKSYKAEGTVIRRSLASFSKNGLVLLNSFPDAEKIYSVCKEFSPFVLGTLRLLAQEHKPAVWYCPCYRSTGYPPYKKVSAFPQKMPQAANRLARQCAARDFE